MRLARQQGPTLDQNLEYGPSPKPNNRWPNYLNPPACNQYKIPTSNFASTSSSLRGMYLRASAAIMSILGLGQLRVIINRAGQIHLIISMHILFFNLTRARILRASGNREL